MEPIVDTSNAKRDPKKSLVIGCFPAPLAFGDEFYVAHVRFFDGDVFREACNALVYTGDELSIGGRQFIREKGDEFWIVRFRTEEDPGDRFAQVVSSPVKRTVHK